MSTAITQYDGRPYFASLRDDEIVEFPELGGPVRAGWREGTLTRAAELEALCVWVEQRYPQEQGRVLSGAVRRHLEAARDAAGVGSSRSRRKRFILHGPSMERAMSNLDAVEAHLLNLEPAADVLGQMPCLLRHVQCHLRPNDSRRQEFERLARRLGIGDSDGSAVATVEPDRAVQEQLVDEERRRIVTIVRAASSAALREQVRLRSFRNIVVTTTMLMTLLAVGLAITGLLYPALVPMCFVPEESGTAVVVCPNGQSQPFVPLSGNQLTDGQEIDAIVAATVRPADLLVIELVGMTAAAIAAAAAIRGLKGSSERYGLPVALAALKLPMGAITAFLGLLLLRGQFVPGLGALDTPAQIVAWALVFGYGQQLFTRLVDQQGQVVLETVRGADKRETGTSSD